MKKPIAIMVVVILVASCGFKTEIKLLNANNAKVSCEITSGLQPSGGTASTSGPADAYRPTTETIVTDQGFSRISASRGDSKIACKKTAKGDLNTIEVQVLVRDSIVSNSLTNKDLGEITATGTAK